MWKSPIHLSECPWWSQLVQIPGNSRPTVLPPRHGSPASILLVAGGVFICPRQSISAPRRCHFQLLCRKQQQHCLPTRP